MKNITVIGGGVLGTQIAFQIAYSGFNTTIWLRSKESVKRTQKKLESVKASYVDAIKSMKNNDINNWCFGIASYEEFNEKNCLKQVEEAFKNIKLELDLKKAVEKADLVIESMTEDFKAKKELYNSLALVLSEKTIVVTNSSTMLPSKLAKYTKRPDMFLAMHFSNSIWKNNIVEVMKHSQTDEKYFNEIISFAKEIKMIPLPLKKEKSGYLLNSMLIPFLFSALDLYVNDISDPMSIDKAWTMGTGSLEGPFQILDVIGLNTAYEIVLMYTKVPSVIAPYNFKKMAKVLKRYIDEGKVGKSSGEGFYKYQK